MHKHVVLLHYAMGDGSQSPERATGRPSQLKLLRAELLGWMALGLLCSIDNLRITAPAAGAGKPYWQCKLGLRGWEPESGFVLPARASPSLLAFARE